MDGKPETPQMGSFKEMEIPRPPDPTALVSFLHQTRFWLRKESWKDIKIILFLCGKHNIILFFS
jgi:hypothetical protein